MPLLCNRLILILENLLCLKSKQADVTTTFLHATLGEDEKVYMEMPLGFKQRGSNRKFEVLCLKKTLYGLRQSHHVFWKYLTEKLGNWTTSSSFWSLPLYWWKGHCNLLCWWSDLLSKEWKGHCWVSYSVACWRSWSRTRRWCCWIYLSSHQVWSYYWISSFDTERSDQTSIGNSWPQCLNWKWKVYLCKRKASCQTCTWRAFLRWYQLMQCGWNALLSCWTHTPWYYLRLYELKGMHLNFLCLFFFLDRRRLQKSWTRKNFKNIFSTTKKDPCGA